MAFSTRSPLVSLLTLLALSACGPAPEPSLSLSGPASLTVFRDLEVDFPLTLQWEGDPRPVTLSGGSSTGLTVVSQQIAAGTTSVQVRVVAAEQASSGEVTVTAEGDGVSAALVIPVQAAAVTLVAEPSGPSLRGGRVEAEVLVEGGEPAFDGVEGARALEQGRWLLHLGVPADASLGADVLYAGVRVGEVSSFVHVPITVSDVARVTMVDAANVPMPGVEIAINRGAWTVTDSAGVAEFPGVAAPYRLDVRRGQHADTYHDVRRASAYPRVSTTSGPMQSKEVRVTVRNSGTGELVTAERKLLTFNFLGVFAGGYGFPDNQAVATNVVQWWSHQTRVTGRMRTSVYDGAALVGLSEELVTLDATDPDPDLITTYVRPPDLGTIHTRITLPPGFSFLGRWPTAVFAGDRWDTLDLPGSGSMNAEATLDSVLVRDDVRHDVHAQAQDLSGRYLYASWRDLSAGDTLEATLVGPPLLSLPAIIGDDQEYRLEGPQWPVYRLTVAVGAGAEQRMETVYSAARVLERSRILTLAPGDAVVTVCGMDSATGVDGLLEGDLWKRPASTSCDRVHEPAWQDP